VSLFLVLASPELVVIVAAVILCTVENARGRSDWM
jgi:Ca2+/H+ antiporter